MVLQRYFEPEFVSRRWFFEAQGHPEPMPCGSSNSMTSAPARALRPSARSMSGGNQQKAIVAREIDKNPDLLVAVQPTRGLDVGAIEYIHKQIVAQRDSGKGGAAGVPGAG